MTCKRAFQSEVVLVTIQDLLEVVAGAKRQLNPLVELQPRIPKLQEYSVQHWAEVPDDCRGAAQLDAPLGSEHRNLHATKLAASLLRLVLLLDKPQIHAHANNPDAQDNL